jgi:hypothetical protein
MKRPCSSLWTDCSPPRCPTISVAGTTRNEGLAARGDLADQLPIDSPANDPDLDQQMVALEGQQQRLVGARSPAAEVSTSESWTRAASSASIVRQANAARAAATVSGGTGSTNDAIRRSSSSSGWAPLPASSQVLDRSSRGTPSRRPHVGPVEKLVGSPVLPTASGRRKQGSGRLMNARQIRVA